MFRRKSKVAAKPRRSMLKQAAVESPTSVAVSSMDANSILITVNERGSDIQTTTTQDTSSTAATTECQQDDDDASRSYWSGGSSSCEDSFDDSSESTITIDNDSGSITNGSKCTEDYSDHSTEVSQEEENSHDFDQDDGESNSSSRGTLNSLEVQLSDVTSLFQKNFSENLSFLESILEQLQCKSPSVEEDEVLWRGCESIETVEKDNFDSKRATKDNNSHSIKKAGAKDEEMALSTVNDAHHTKSAKSSESTRSLNLMDSNGNNHPRTDQNNVVVEPAQKQVKKNLGSRHRFTPVAEASKEQHTQSVKRDTAMVSNLVFAVID
jgi:hypothetical protein